MPTTTYTTPTASVAAVGSRTDAAGAAVNDFTAEEARFGALLFTEGYLTPATAFKVEAQAVPNMTVKVGSGVAKADYYVVVGEVAGQGNYIARLDVTSQNVTIDAADASQTRTDEIYLVVRDHVYDASSRVLPQLGYRKGDLGGANPGVDAAWRASVLLARITVAAAASTITNANITDLRAASRDGSVQRTLVDAKGDLIVASAADTVVRVPVGTDGYVLAADSTESAGVEWALRHYALLADYVFPGGTYEVTLSSIPQTHKHLMIVIKASSTAGFGQIYCRINGSSSNHYDTQTLLASGTSIIANNFLSLNAMEVGIVGDSNPSANECLVADYSVSGLTHPFICRTAMMTAGGPTEIWHAASRNWSNTSPITSLYFLLGGSGDFIAGSHISLYGLI